MFTRCNVTKGGGGVFESLKNSGAAEQKELACAHS